jgi:hypothetical protein
MHKEWKLAKTITKKSQATTKTKERAKPNDYEVIEEHRKGK